jgi:4-amino-4-deoxy-L-arabinose transferase-like glycosyltransferase
MTDAVSRYRAMLIAFALGVAALLVAGRDLARAPVYLHHDEVIYALNAHSILSTGRDLTGLRFPLFFHTFAWVPPIAIYARVLTFMVAPVTEFTIRFPGVIFFALDVSLTYLLARRLFRQDGLAVLAAVLAMLTPAHVIHARLATDHICHVPLFILFVLATIDYVERRRLVSLGAATFCLGLGVYGYIGAMTLAPVYLALVGGLLLFALEIRTLRPYLIAGTGFAVALLPFAIWLLVHPEQLADQLRSYGVSGGGSGARMGTAVASTLTLRLDAYYNFFDPALLFFQGDQSLIDSTREVGVFLLPVAVFLPVGVYRILTHHRTLPDQFVLIGLLVAPMGALIVGESKASRALVMVPLAALVCARGVEALLAGRSVLRRSMALALLGVLVLQFQIFYRDYTGDYRERSSLSFEGNRDAAIGSLVARADATRAPVLYVSSDIVLVNVSWQFYALRHARPDLKNRMVSFNRESDLGATPAGSVFLVVAEPKDTTALDSAGLTRVATIDNADRHPGFAVYEK